MQEHVTRLATSKLHKFADWPNRDIPHICAGVYAIYDRDGQFIYVGMAGAELTKDKSDQKQASKKKSGLYDRLGSHASGQRSGDRFNIYIGDLYLLGKMSPEDIQRIAKQEVSFDSFIKKFIRAELSYRYVVVPNSIVRTLENHIQSKGISGQLPRINGKG